MTLVARLPPPTPFPFLFVLADSPPDLPDPIHGAVRPGPSDPFAALRHPQAWRWRVVGPRGAYPCVGDLYICEGSSRGKRGMPHRERVVCDSLPFQYHMRTAVL